MLLTSGASFKTARRHLKRFHVVPVSLFLIGAVFLGSFLFRGNTLKDTFRDTLYDGSALFLSLVETPFNNFSGYQKSFERHLYLQKNAEALERSLSQLKTYQHKVQSLEMRNRELRDLLSLQGMGSEPFITAACFGQNAFLNTQSLFIHAGHKSGIQRFDVAMSEGAIIGQVDQIGAKTSRVLLINDVHSKIPVMSQNSQKEGVLVGLDDGTISLSFMDKFHELEVGEMLFSSGVDGYFPRGLPIGKILKVEGDVVSVSPLVDIKNLHYVQVQKSSGGEVQ